MKIKGKITYGMPTPNGFVIAVSAQGCGHIKIGTEIELEIPDPPPVKSDGQKAYENHPLAPATGWDKASIKERNTWHKIAAAVTGKPPVVEKEPEPAKPAKSVAERFHDAFRYPYVKQNDWRDMHSVDRRFWLECSARFEAAK